MIATKRKAPVGVSLDGFEFSNEGPLALIGGPCVIESPALTLTMARQLARLAVERQIPFVFKASYDKANRSSATSFRGPGIQKGLEILKRVKDEVGCPILTDVHWKEDVE